MERISLPIQKKSDVKGLNEMQKRKTTGYRLEGDLSGGAIGIFDSQLYATDEGSEEAHHAQELHQAQVLHRVLLAQVGHGVEDGAEQHQPIAQDDVTRCEHKDAMINGTAFLWKITWGSETPQSANSKCDAIINLFEQRQEAGNIQNL